MKTHIVMNDFAKEYRSMQKDLLRKVDRVFMSGKYILGSNVSAFEGEFAQ